MKLASVLVVLVVLAGCGKGRPASAPAPDAAARREAARAVDATEAAPDAAAAAQAAQAAPPAAPVPCAGPASGAPAAASDALAVEGHMFMKTCGELDPSDLLASDEPQDMEMDADAQEMLVVVKVPAAVAERERPPSRRADVPPREPPVTLTIRRGGRVLARREWTGLPYSGTGHYPMLVTPPVCGAPMDFTATVGKASITRRLRFALPDCARAGDD